MKPTLPDGCSILGNREQRERRHGRILETGLGNGNVLADPAFSFNGEGHQSGPRPLGEQEPPHGSPNGSFRASVGTGSSHTETTGMSPANLRIPASLE